MIKSNYYKNNRFMFYKYLCLTVLILSTIVNYLSIISLPDEDKQLKIMIIPLDDRPINYDDVIKLSESFGFDILIPNRDIIRTDYMNSDNTSEPKNNYGNTSEINQWIDDNMAEADAFILSLDMISNGGLVGSRTNHFTLDDMINHLKILKEIKDKYPQKTIFAFDSIMRLAETSTGSKESLINYNISRAFGHFPNNHSIISSSDINEKLKEFGIEVQHKNIERWQKENQKNYLDSRLKSLTANSIALDYVKNSIIDYLILGIDDSNIQSIQDKEINHLYQKISTYGIENKTMVFDGTDECILMLLSKYITNVFLDREVPIRLSLYGEVDLTDSFERLSIRENLHNHITAVNGIINNEITEIDLILITNDANITDQKKAIEKVDYNYLHQIPTMIVDKSSTYELSYFSKNLMSSKDLPLLFGYSGWNTTGNSIGIALAMGIGRYSVVTSSDKIVSMNDTASAHLELLANRLVKDLIIRNGVRLINHYDKESEDDFFKTVKTYTENFLHETFINSSYISFIDERVSLNQIMTISPVIDDNIFFPWDRSFDINIDFEVKIK